jgi:hypothetical protein
VAGKACQGLSAEGLPPKWFTKNPETPFEADLAEMIAVIQNAARIGKNAGQTSGVFADWWRAVQDEQTTWAGLRTVPPLLAGLGVSVVERSVLDGTEIVVVRPLLGFTRQEIAAYARSRRLNFREDATNTSRAHTRNRLRHDVLPALAQAVGFDPVPALARAADLLASEDEALEGLVCARAGSAQLETRRLRREPVALQRRWLRAWLRERTGIECDYDTIERARALALGTTMPAKTNLPRGWHLRRRAGKLFVEQAPRRK